MPLKPGLAGRSEQVVDSADLATAMGSGTVEVLSTPRVLAWLEAACVEAVEGHLDPGETTVGMRTRFDHVRASVVGATVLCRAELERVDGRRLTFAVSAVEHDEEIAAGHLTRVIVNAARFVDRANQ